MTRITTARSVMTEPVISVSPEASLLDVLRLFFEEDIHAVPVVGDQGQLIGVISSSDLLRAQESERDPARAMTDYMKAMFDFSFPDWSENLEDFQDRLGQITVAEVMTRTYVSVPSDEPVADVARQLRENQIHHVWVEHEGQVCGVVSTLDLMPVIEQAADRA